MTDSQNNSSDIVFDEQNPSKTLSDIAEIEESEAEEIVQRLSLTEYVALVTAIQNKDMTQVTDIIDKNIEKQQSVEEALDVQAKGDLQKLVSKLPKTAVPQPSATIGNVKPVPAGNPPSTTSGSPPTTSTQSSLSTSTTNTIKPTGTTGVTTPTTNQPSIVSVDTNTDTVAVSDPAKQNKISILSVKDPNQTSEIKDLMKRAGVSGV